MSRLYGLKFLATHSLDPPHLRLRNRFEDKFKIIESVLISTVPPRAPAIINLFQKSDDRIESIDIG
jgi:hypothetical protein